MVFTMDTVSLDNVPSGRRVEIVEILHKGKWLINRLYSLGLIPGAVIEIVSNHNRGPLIVKLNNVEIAIGRGIARRIIVKNIG